MNPLLRHFFFSSLENQINDLARKNSKKEYGKLMSVSFIVKPETTIQRIKFEMYEGDSVLTEKERNGFASIVGIDIDKEMNSCKSIFCIIQIEKKLIVVTYNYVDGKTKTINI